MNCHLTLLLLAALLIGAQYWWLVQFPLFDAQYAEILDNGEATA